jgi:hypothetical protein
VAFCRSCGKPLCQACQRFAQGTVFCAEHAPPVAGGAAGAGAAASPSSTANPYTSTYADLPPNNAAVPASGVSPGLAFVLGLIPGVGAIYNGQYAKGLVHLIIFGLILSILNSDGAGELTMLFGLLVPGWVLYMAFEAYHTARKRQLGLVVDEFSSIFPLRQDQQRAVPVGPVILIVLGILFLLNNLDVLSFRAIIRYWPLTLIGLGIYMLYLRFTGEGNGAPSRPTTVVNQEVPHEQ